MTLDMQTLNERLDALDKGALPAVAQPPIGTAGPVRREDFQHPYRLPMSVEELVPLVEALEPLKPGERARVLLYCLLRYLPDAFSHSELFGLLERAKKP